MPAPRSSEGAKVPLVTVPASASPTSTGFPSRGIPAPSIRNGASFSAVPSARAAGDRLGADEPRRLLAGPAEPGLDRVALGRELVAVQREADLEPQGVAGAEPAGDDAGFDQLLPDRRRDLGVDQQLDPVLAGVAGAAGERRPAADLDRGDVHPRRQLDPQRALEDAAGVRALDGEHRVAVGDVADGDVEAARDRAELARSVSWLAALVTTR